VLLPALQHTLHHVIVVIAVHRRSRQPVLVVDNRSACIRQYTSAYASICQHTSADVAHACLHYRARLSLCCRVFFRFSQL
jgi:hypothetical protein